MACAAGRGHDLFQAESVALPRHPLGRGAMGSKRRAEQVCTTISQLFAICNIWQPHSILQSNNPLTLSPHDLYSPQAPLCRFDVPNACRNWTTGKTGSDDPLCIMMPLFDMVNHDRASDNRIRYREGAFELVHEGDGIEAGQEVRSAFHVPLLMCQL